MKDNSNNIHTVEYHEDNGDIAMAEVNAINLDFASNESRGDNSNTNNNSKITITFNYRKTPVREKGADC